MGWEPMEGLNTKSKPQGNKGGGEKKNYAYVLFFNLPHKGAKGQSQKQAVNLPGPLGR